MQAILHPVGGLRAGTALLGIATTVCAALVTAAPAAACSIGVPAGYDPIRDPYKAAQIAITGKVTTVRRSAPAEGTWATDFVATVRISRVYKGKTGPAIRVRGNTEGSTCGFGPIEQGEAIALLIDGGRSPFPIAVLARTSYRNLEIASGGRSHRPGRR